MMDILVKQGSIEAAEVDTIIVNLFDDVTIPAGATGAVDAALDGAVSELIASGDLTGKEGEVGVIYPRGSIAARRVLVVGLGRRDKFSLEGVRRAAGAAIKKAQALKSQRVATVVHGAGVAGLPAGAAAEATVLASLLAAYRYPDAPVPEDGLPPAIASLTVVEHDESKLAEITAAATTAQTIAAGAMLARDLVNRPPNVVTPRYMAKTAKAIATEFGLGLTIGGRKWAAERDMGAFLAVAKGAGEPPKFIVLTHNEAREDLDTVVLVGKGITFDTGGISIKASANMEAMKTDMGGAAAVMGAMRTVAALDLPLRVIGIMPCTENMPDANAYRPADVITASNGKTIEIISTDAEGRMVLADGLVFANRYAPAAVIDLATLTGSCVVALGEEIAAGLFCTDEWLQAQLVAAGAAAWERVWPLPLWDEYRDAIKSDVANMKNSGGRFGGVGTSAIFLKEFTSYPWAHLDIAGMVSSKSGGPYTPAGATGFGVRLLVDFLRNWANQPAIN